MLNLILAYCAVMIDDCSSDRSNDCDRVVVRILAATFTDLLTY
jgi:hypothetical protein